VDKEVIFPRGIFQGILYQYGWWHKSLLPREKQALELHEGMGSGVVWG